MTVEIPEALRKAMEAQGNVDPDEVAAKAAALLESGELDAPEKPPAPPATPTAVIEGQESLLGVMAPPTGEELRDEGMARAERAAPEEWKDAAWHAIVALANAGADFTADDVWAKVGFAPPEPRALGPLLVRAQKAGMIRNTGNRRSSTRPEHHAFPCAVWEPCS
jgi:hypothetical protein